MKKMNRSQSSYRQCKTLLSDEDSDSWAGRLPRAGPTRQQPNLVNSFLDANKENNSLYQSISERNFASKPRDNTTDYEPAYEVIQQLQEKNKQLERQVSQLHDGSSLSNSKACNYSEKYYQSEIESLKALVKQKDREFEFHKHEFSSKNEEMDSMNSELSTKMEKDQKDKNLYIKEINHKAIENTHLQERVKYQKAEIETLKICLEDKDKSVKEFQDKFGQVDMKKKKIEHYESSIKEREEMLRELEAQTQRFKLEADCKDALIADKVKAVGELEQTIGSYDDKLKSIEVNLLTIKEQKKTAEEKNEEVRRESEEWRHNYQEMLKKNEDLQENEFKLKTYQSMVEDLNKRNLELSSHNEKMKISCSSLEKHVSKHTEAERESSRLRQDLKDREEQIFQLQAREKSYRHLEDCYTKVRKEKDEHFVKIQEKTKENKAINLQLEECRLRVQGLEEELLEEEESSQRNKERADKIDRLMKENNRLNQNLQDKINEIEKLQIRLNNMDSKLGDKSSENAKLRTMAEEREESIAEMDMEIKDLRERYQIQTNNRIIQEDTVLKLTQENFTLKCNSNKLDNEKGQLSAQIDALVSSHEAEVTQFRTVLAENEAAQQHTQQSLASYQDKVQHLNLETEECRRELQDWSQKETEHKVQLGRLEQLVLELREEKTRLASDKNKIIERCGQLKDIHDYVMGFREGTALQ